MIFFRVHALGYTPDNALVGSREYDQRSTHAHTFEHHAQYFEPYERQYCRSNAERIHAGPYRQTYTGRSPYAGGCGQPAHELTLYYYRSGPYETYAAHHLRGDTAWVKTYAGIGQYIDTIIISALPSDTRK